MYDDAWDNEDYAADYDYGDWDDDRLEDEWLAQQELDDFCQDGYFENMEAGDIL